MRLATCSTRTICASESFMTCSIREGRERFDFMIYVTPTPAYCSSKARAKSTEGADGHSSIQVTVDIYGHLIPGGNKVAVDRVNDLWITQSFRRKPQPAQPREAGGIIGRSEALDSMWCARQELNLRPAGSKGNALRESPHMTVTQ